MANIIPFESAALPAHLAASVSNIDELFAGGGSGFPVLSIKGKVFRIKRGEDIQLLERPDEPGTPASGVELVILRAQVGVSKTYYAKGYTDGATESPDCASSDGIKPDAGVAAPQCATCAACPHNAWGSKVNEQGKELKACQDNKRLAVAAPSLIKDPMLLRVPPASFKSLNEYAKLLKVRNVGFNAVVTRVSFAVEAATPQLLFKPVGFLDAATFAETNAAYNDDVVQQIIGLLPSGVGAADIADAPATGQTPAAAAAPEAAPAAAPEAAKRPQRARKPAADVDPVPAEVVAAATAAPAAPPPAAAPAATAAPAAEPVIELDASIDQALAEALGDLGLDFDD